MNTQEAIRSYTMALSIRTGVALAFEYGIGTLDDAILEAIADSIYSKALRVGHELDTAIDARQNYLNNLNL